jgi:hypothetical protein
MSDVFCVGLVFSRDQYRYRTYARLYVEALLRLQKTVAIFSPNWIELNNYLHTHFRDQAKRIHCFAIDATCADSVKVSKTSFAWRYLTFSRRLRSAERSMQTKIDFVFFAPVDDWIKPKFGKGLFDWAFPYNWSGLLINMLPYEENGLKLNVDPKYAESDYLFTSKNCVGVCTLNRFSSEALKSRVYKKVVVMPDLSELDLPETTSKIAQQIRKMAKHKMIVGTILLEEENPENFLALANEAPFDQYFFVCAGSLDASFLSERSRDILSQILSSGRNNNYFMLNNLEESEDINDILCTFDVCYLNDGDFQLPHPLLTKAAHFSKPVIGSKRDMIGKLVQTFNTGITVNGSVNESINALATMRYQMPFEKNFDLSKLKNYAQLQSQEALRDAWEMLLLF